MEKVNAYQRKKDYSHLKDKHKDIRYRHRKQNNDIFISLEEKIGLQLVLCAIILTTLVVGKLFNVSNITKFETIISKTISNDSFEGFQNTEVGAVFVDLQNAIKEQININVRESVPTINTQESQQIEQKIDTSNYKDTVIEKK